MNDVTILDLFWLILKFLVALGLVCLIGFALYLVWRAVKRSIRVAWNIVRGRQASVTATVCFVIALVALVTGIIFAGSYLHDHPNLLQQQPEKALRQSQTEH
jgi:predicted PurR-regulated permease PerM